MNFTALYKYKLGNTIASHHACQANTFSYVQQDEWTEVTTGRSTQMDPAIVTPAWPAML